MAGSRRVSIKDVAREAGVSVTTVSHALNGKGRLNPETRERVRGVAARLGYAPNPAARSLVSGRTGLIAVMASLPAEPRVEFADFGYLTALIAAATGVTVARDRALVVAPPSTNGFVWDRVPVDGVIVIDPMVGEPALPALRERDMPFVTISADPAGSESDAVVASEDIDATCAILDHFLERGAKRVALLTVPPINAFLQHTADAYVAWCERRDQRILLEFVDLREIERQQEQALRDCVDRLLDREDPPDAIYAPLELVGVAVARIVLAKGWGIPEHVLFATTHDAGRAANAEPPITTIEWNYEEVGTRAATLLLDILDGARSAPCVELVPGRVVARTSTAP
ncbi:MAG TPA: LacI family DNA-binding transcriptional regulator [Actinomycetota bacterium]|nr:LacI family DNA-binding transcriptional regulator [Actinomycetota bacterium]